MRILKQSTATTIVLGPFVDSTDGNTAETGLTIAQADVLLWKQGGTTLAQKNDATGATHRSNGLYTCPINTTDTGTLGQLIVSVAPTGALQVRHDYTVVPAVVYDSLVAGTGAGLLANIASITASTAAATKLAAGAGTMVIGTVDDTAHSPTATEFECDDITTAPADSYNGRVLIVTSGTYAGKATLITDYAVVGGRGHFTVDSLGNALGNNDTILIF